MSDTAYPLLRQRRRRTFTRLDPRLVRVLAFLILGGLLIAGVAVARRPRAETPAQLVADTRATLAAGNYSAARRNGEKAVAAAQASAPTHLLLAQVYLRLGEGLAAEGELDRAVATGGSNRHDLRAEARLLQGDPAGAIAEAGLANGRAERVRAQAFAAQGDTAAAQALLAQVATTANDPRAWTALGRLRFGIGELGGAAQAASETVRRAPNDPTALTLQGEVVRARYGPVAALPWFAAALQRDAYYQPALLQQAATLGDAGRYAQALAATRQALRAKPGSVPALYMQAVIAARAGRRDLAERVLGAGRGFDGFAGGLLLQASLDESAGRHEQAIAGLRRLVDAQPMNVAARRLLGAALFRSGDPRASLEMLRPIAMRTDADAYTLRLAGRAMEAIGDRDTAATLLDRAAGARGPGGLFATNEGLGALTAGAAAAPTDPTYAIGVVRGLAMSGDRSGALAKARALALAAPGAPAAQLAFGDVAAANGDWPTATAAYTRAADLQFDEPTALRLADALGRTGRAQQAATALALYLGQNPQSVPGQRLRGHWLVASGDWAAAIETLEGVRRQIGARDAGLLADLAYAYAGAGQGDVARRYGAAAYALLPMNAAVCDAYGAGLAADGDMAGARQLLDKALALAPGDPMVAEHRRRIG